MTKEENQLIKKAEAIKSVECMDCECLDQDKDGLKCWNFNNGKEGKLFRIRYMSYSCIKKMQVDMIKTVNTQDKLNLAHKIIRFGNSIKGRELINKD
ncbi:hypothetical protein HN803_07635 [candidate division WWE3 bacterium]|nr:hypothetical protein [candidate division WWE3 bacterium]